MIGQCGVMKHIVVRGRKMDENYLNTRSQELIIPIHKQIMMCDDKSDLIMLCFLMMNTAKQILDEQCGENFRKLHFSEFN
jgi:hypothetical protein